MARGRGGEAEGGAPKPLFSFLLIPLPPTQPNCTFYHRIDVASTACWWMQVVCVSVNYRLAMHGHMHLPKQKVTNLALRDLIASLEWIKREIAA